MREHYWKMYANIKYRSYYYKHFQILIGRINFVLSAFCTLASLSCVAAWGIWGSHPVLWSLIICASQVVQVLFPKLPYNNLLVSTQFIIRPLEKLLLDIDHTWLDMEYVHEYSDSDIISFIRKYEQQYDDLVSQFFANISLPEYKYIVKKSEKDYDKYFERKYSVKKEVQNE